MKPWAYLMRYTVACMIFVPPYHDVIRWKHFPRYWPFVLGIHRSPVNSPHKGQWRRALMFSLICVWINDLANNREAGDLRHYRAHYDVTVMPCFFFGNPIFGFLLTMQLTYNSIAWNSMMISDMLTCRFVRNYDVLGTLQEHIKIILPSDLLFKHDVFEGKHCILFEMKRVGRSCFFLGS